MRVTSFDEREIAGSNPAHCESRGSLVWLKRYNSPRRLLASPPFPLTASKRDSVIVAQGNSPLPILALKDAVGNGYFAQQAPSPWFKSRSRYSVAVDDGYFVYQTQTSDQTSDGFGQIVPSSLLAPKRTQYDGYGSEITPSWVWTNGLSIAEVMHRNRFAA